MKAMSTTNWTVRKGRDRAERIDAGTGLSLQVKAVRAFYQSNWGTTELPKGAPDAAGLCVSPRPTNGRIIS